MASGTAPSAANPSQQPGDAYEQLNISHVPDAPVSAGPPPAHGGGGEGKDDADEKKELTDNSKRKKKTGGSSNKSKVGSTMTKTKTSMSQGSKGSASGGKGKQKKKKGKKEKKEKKPKKPKKTAHFKKRGNPMFKVLCLVCSAVSVVCLIGALICGIMLAA